MNAVSTPADASAPVRKSKTIFIAKVTPAEIIDAIDINNKPYLRMPNAHVKTTNTERPRSVMAFGKSFSTVRPSLIPGVPVDLVVQLDGGSMKILGFPREKTVATNDDAPASIAA